MDISSNEGDRQIGDYAFLDQVAAQFRINKRSKFHPVTQWNKLVIKLRVFPRCARCLPLTGFEKSVGFVSDRSSREQYSHIDTGSRVT